MGTKNQFFICLLCLFFIGKNAIAQECSNFFTIKLQNIRGGVFALQLVTMKSVTSGKEFTQKSDSKGEAIFTLPCKEVFELTVSNYVGKLKIETYEFAGARMSKTLSYEPNMAEKEKAFSMSDADKLKLDESIATLPDSTIIYNSRMTKPKALAYYVEVTLRLQNLEGKPLANETITFEGQKRKKKFKGATNTSGIIIAYLPKGDKYFVNFLYDKEFYEVECKYALGTAQTNIGFSYLGTKEVEKRKKEEAERIAREEKRLKEEREAFEKYCRDAKITLEEGYKRKAREAAGSTADTVVLAVLNRNNWSEKLIVCDLTGSMMPYSAQLSVWYQLAYKKEKNLQFVFFNDGDNKSDALKKIGETGGIYYSPDKGAVELTALMAKVSSAGGGGDCAENNMEALIKGNSLAKPYKELVMIADNNAPVKDITLLKSFNTPVHIIVCGAYNGVLEDYLNIARKTNGSIHTIEEDIKNLSSLAEGKEIIINHITYKIMGGRFVRISGL